MKRALPAAGWMGGWRSGSAGLALNLICGEGAIGDRQDLWEQSLLSAMPSAKIKPLRMNGLVRGAARIRTGDGGFAIRCLSRLATAPKVLSNHALWSKPECRRLPDCLPLSPVPCHNAQPLASNDSLYRLSWPIVLPRLFGLFQRCAVPVPTPKRIGDYRISIPPLTSTVAPVM